MTLIEELKKNNYSFIASNGYHSNDIGIKPVLDRVKEDIYYFEDLEVADKAIGKASAMLLVLSKVKKVDTILISKAGKEILDKYNIPYTFEKTCEYIINRTGDDMCPMEKMVKDIDDLDLAFEVLKAKQKQLAAK